MLPDVKSDPHRPRCGVRTVRHVIFDLQIAPWTIRLAVLLDSLRWLGRSQEAAVLHTQFSGRLASSTSLIVDVGMDSVTYDMATLISPNASRIGARRLFP